MGVMALAAALAVAISSSADAQADFACLVVNNAWYPETKAVSVQVAGYGQHYWDIPNMTTVTLVNGDNGPLLRGANFTISIYEGSGGSQGGGLIETSTSGGPNNHVLWTYVEPQNTDERVDPACNESGYWLALIHG